MDTPVSKPQGASKQVRPSYAWSPTLPEGPLLGAMSGAGGGSRPRRIPGLGAATLPHFLPV